MRLHIIHGYPDSDKDWLERAARDRLDWNRPNWIAPSTSKVDDYVIIYVAGYGFFATARVKLDPEPRRDRKNRWGVGLKRIRLIGPPISLAAIRSELPQLKWANYPRSITTVPVELERPVRNLIAKRRKKRPDLTESILMSGNAAELYRLAVADARRVLTPKERKVLQRTRSRPIHRFVIVRSKGHCEGCGVPAPFVKPDGSPYLEPHHVTCVADNGPDHPAKVIALCPTCHRRAHHANNHVKFNQSLKRKLDRIVARQRY